MKCENVFPQGSFDQEAAGVHETLVGIRLVEKQINLLTNSLTINQINLGRISSVSSQRKLCLDMCDSFFHPFAQAIMNHKINHNHLK